MPYNNISHEITPASLAMIQQALKTLKDELHFGVNLTPEERKALPKMGDGSWPFVQKSMTYVQSNPEYLPAYLNKVEFERDYNLAVELDKISQQLQQLTQLVEHTQMAAGSEAMQVALQYYHTVKMAATQNNPGAGAIADDLAKRYAKNGSRKSSDASDNQGFSSDNSDSAA